MTYFYMYLGRTPNIYIDNKKVGTAGDGGYGGEVEIYIMPEYRGEFSKRIKDYYEKNPSAFHNEVDFINEIYELVETEKNFKKFVKKGFSSLIHLSYMERIKGFNHDIPYKPSEIVGVKEESIISQQIEKYKPVEYEIYRSLEDFVL